MQAKDTAQKRFLRFVSKLTDALTQVSPDDLNDYERWASEGYVHLIPILKGCEELLRRFGPEINRPVGSYRLPVRNRYKDSEHLFDLLRSKEYFPTNLELAQFASHILPDMSAKRFDKMSRADIAARIIEYLETFDPRTRKKAEYSMRTALMRLPASEKGIDQSFFSQWQRIIKGIEL
jgi:hypothetical protein